jgi:parallel beta-helix repeat protein
LPGRQRRPPRRILAPRVEPLEGRLLLTGFVVSNFNNGGPGSLAQAILDSNGAGGSNTISFQFDPGLTPHPIAGPLPEVDTSVTIDASNLGSTGAPFVRVDGGSGTLLPINAGNCIIRGLALTNSQGTAIDLMSAAFNDLIQGCTIGLGGSNQYGITIEGYGNTIGGTTAAQRNLIVSNTLDGILISSAPGSAPHNNLVEGNYIGTDGSANDLGNKANGIEIRTGVTATTIGSTTSGAGNVISGNGGDGILLTVGSNTTLIEGNSIGLAADGTNTLGNRNNGVEIQNCIDNTIGGMGGGTGNTIAGNGRVSDTGTSEIGDGILIAGAAASNNVVSGNTIGSGNFNFGVEIQNAPGNTVGGTSAAAANAISGNGISNVPNLPYGNQGGVLIDGAGATGNLVQSNNIGSTADGSALEDNTGPGVEILDASSNTIGGPGGLGNEIVGANFSSDGGVLITTSMTGEATDNAVYGNLIGLSRISRTPLGIGGDGVAIINASTNAIGGDGDLGNEIVACSDHAINIAGFQSNMNGVYGNYIGIDRMGNAAAADANESLAFASLNPAAILINGATATAIGSTELTKRNYISNNNGFGVEITGDSARSNQVHGNVIGTDSSGLVARPNSLGGVAVYGGSTNTVGGGSSADGNVISGNMGPGVAIGLPKATVPAMTSATVGQNFIGVGSDGKTPLGNAGDGVTITSRGNTIGGRYGRNVISGNAKTGVHLTGFGVEPGAALDDNTVQENTIGLSSDLGTAVGNGQYGIWIDSGYGDTVTGNIIAGNQSAGVEIDGTTAGSASGNTITSNFIGNDGQNHVFGNKGPGVRIDSVSANTVGGIDSSKGNVITANANGVVITAQSSKVASADSILRNSIYGNTGLGIDLIGGANNAIIPPQISAVTASAVMGTVTAPPNTVATLQIFSNDPRADSNYQGQTFENTTQLSMPIPASGHEDFTVPLAVSSSKFVTATVTDAGGNTSEFSGVVTGNPPVAVPATATVQVNRTVRINVLAQDPPYVGLTVTSVSDTNASIDPSTGEIIYQAGGLPSPSGGITFNYTIQDATGRTSTSTVTVTVVADYKLAPTDLALTEPEGSAFFNVVASFADADPMGQAADFTAAIDWGDGKMSAASGSSSPPTIVYNPTTKQFDVLGTHTYAESDLDVRGMPGGYPVVVSVLDVGGSKTTVNSTITVPDAEIGVAARPVNANVGQALDPQTEIARFFDADPAATTPDHYRVQIGWGDGQTSDNASLTIVPLSSTSYIVKAGHTYQTAGSFPIKVAVTDTTVNPPPPDRVYTDTTTATVGSGIAPPSPPNTPVLAAEDDSGASNSDGLTQNNGTFNAPLDFNVDGVVPPDATVQLIDLNTAAKLGPPTQASGGVALVRLAGDPSAALGDGVYKVAAQSTTAAGTSAPSPPLTLTIQTTLTLTATNPSDGAVIAALPGNQITLTFNHPLYGLTDGGFAIGPYDSDPVGLIGPQASIVPVTSVYHVSPDGLSSTIVLTPLAGLGPGTYLVRVDPGGYSDLAGNGLVVPPPGGGFTFTIQTPGPTPSPSPTPTSTSTAPRVDGVVLQKVRKGRVNEGTGTIEINFSVPMDPGAGSAANYALVTPRKPRGGKGKGPGFTPVGFTAGYDPATTSVKLTLSRPTKQALLLTVRKSVTSANGLSLPADVTLRVQ